MKSIIKKLTILVVLLTSCIVYPRQTSAQESNVSFQVFYDQLSPYGEWVNDEHYGYVWFPDVSADFVPYSTDGRWILSDYGWTWASDYDWGWAAFHYGRWGLNDSYGWFWIPDNEWGPAWVNWRQADGYYGWSPMEPGMTLDMSYGRDYESYNHHWIFVRDIDIERSNLHNYYIERSEQDRIGRNSTVIRNTYRDNNRHTTYVSGPSRSDVQRVVGRTINPVVIQENSRPGQVINNGQLRIYRPQITTNERRPVPTRVSNINEIRHSQGNGTTNPRKISPADNNPARQPNSGNQLLNNGAPAQQRNDNQRNNDRQAQPMRTPVPASPGSITPATQPQRTYPNTNDRQGRPNDVTTPRSNNQQPTNQRNVSPQNNTVRPDQQQNTNSQNKADQPAQQRYVAPQNNTVQPNQQRNAYPQNNTVQPNQQRNVSPQNNTVPTDQQRNVTPQNNTISPNQQRNVSPQNNTVQPNQQRNVSPQNNNTQPNQQRNVNPQNNNSMQQNNNNQGQRQPAPGNIQNKPQPNQPIRGNQPVTKGLRPPQKQAKPQKQIEKPIEVKPETDRKRTD